MAVLYRSSARTSLPPICPTRWPCWACAWLAWLWARRAWGERAGLYAGLGVLTSIGPFLFTRFIIPEALLSFFLLFALYCLLTGFESEPAGPLLRHVGGAGAGQLTKGLIAPDLFCRRGHSPAPVAPANGGAGGS